jgi:hypothetical protein
MTDIDEKIRRIGQAKAFIDNGLCRVGPKLDKEDCAAGLMAGGASRVLGLADAVAHLSRQDSPAEALPILRQLADTAVNMRWLSCDEAARSERAAQWQAELEGAQWETLWSATKLAERAQVAGCSEAAASVVGLAKDFTLGNRTIAPWSHVFSINQHAAPGGEQVLAVAVELMGHVLTALETTWPQSFPGAEAMWAPY